MKAELDEFVSAIAGLAAERLSEKITFGDLYEYNPSAPSTTGTNLAVKMVWPKLGTLAKSWKNAWMRLLVAMPIHRYNEKKSYVGTVGMFLTLLWI